MMMRAARPSHRETTTVPYVAKPDAFGALPPPVSKPGAPGKVYRSPVSQAMLFFMGVIIPSLIPHTSS